MGNNLEIDLNKYSCSSCTQDEDGCFIDFLKDTKSRDPFNFFTTPEKLSPSD